jgi:hypothetical protein
MDEAAVPPPVKDESRVCFVVSPIGELSTPTRRRSDQVLRHIIEPVVADLGYSAVRADALTRPGIITNQVIQMVADADLVVADP